VYYHSNQAGGWSQEGVQLDKDNSNVTIVTCFTTHLTSFAVLVTIQDKSVSSYGFLTDVNNSYSLLHHSNHYQ